METKKIDEGIVAEITYLQKTHELMCEIDILNAKVEEIENNIISITSILKQHNDNLKKLIELAEDHEAAYQFMTVNLAPRTEELEKTSLSLMGKINK